ncbi:MAG TPA: SMC-Scp complex subunit ScpB [Acidobacteriaceae bacterium]|nr:SMC-Scp complex subunit ScpB [Acidobacteriaceae bacterium]
MSLKAKIEAVIYAAEEPVTLAQIAALFQTELLEQRAGRVSAEAAAQEEFVSESDVVTQPTLGVPGAEPEESGDGNAAAAAPATVDGEAAAEPAEPSPEDEKKIARQKEREARDEARRIVDLLIEEYGEGDRGIEIREIAGGYRLGTKPEYHDAVRSFVKSLKPPMKLSLQALETLAVIAYKQPVTAPEISEIRGVDSAGVLGSLISRKLITTAGRKQVIGRPILYKTTKEFLLRFGLKDLNELPSMEEFEKMAGELAETDEPTPGNELPFEGQAGEEQAEEAAREGSE